MIAVLVVYAIIGVFLGSESIHRKIYGSAGPGATFFIYVLLWPVVVIANLIVKGRPL